jgi:penicillin-binding protein 1A
MIASPMKKNAKETAGMDTARRARTQQNPAGTFFRRTLLALTFLVLGGVAGLVVVFYYFSLTLPTIGPLLEGYDPPETTRILASDGTVIGELFLERRTVVPLDKIPKVMVNAVIAAEDADFRKHTGLDYPGMIRAILTNLVSGRIVQGASTITQQVARTFFLTREKTYSRKIREILLTKKIEERLTKDEILFLYLNQINFGHARYGVCEAARFYFGKDTENITLAEAALLAGIPKGPAIYSPLSHPEAAKKRRAYVIGEMLRLGTISAIEAKRVEQAPLGIVPGRGIDSGFAPEAVSLAIAEIENVVDVESLRRGGYTIETTLDPKLQSAARAAVRAGLSAYDERHKLLAPFKASKRWPEGDRGVGGRVREGRTYVGQVTGHDDGIGRIYLKIGDSEGFIDMRKSTRYNPTGLKASGFAAKGAKLHISPANRPEGGEPIELRLEAGPQAALVALDTEDGSLRAIVGGDSMRPGDFDRAASAHRQPGSAFKPFVYLAAIRSGRYTPATILDDAPEVVGEWQPKNSSEDKFVGAVRLRQALAKSLNLPSVKLIADLTPEYVADLAARMGITSKLDPTPALALGASAVCPLEIASAFDTIAGRGKRRSPFIIKRVSGPDGVDIPLIGRSPEQVITEQEAYLITSLLESVVKEGTGTGAQRLKRPAAGKTGTSDKQRDAWFVGFTPQVVCAVWMGYDDYRSLGSKEYGGRAALPIWVDFMKKAHEKLEKSDFIRPLGIVNARIDSETGLLAYEGAEEAMDEIFIEGTEPTETAVPPNLVSPDNFLLDQAAGDAGTQIQSAGKAVLGDSPR